MRNTILIAGSLALSLSMMGCDDSDNTSSAPPPVESQPPQQILKYSQYKPEHLFSDVDGRNPVTTLAIDKDGNLYGSAEHGGPDYDPSVDEGGNGVIFKFTPSDGRLTTLHEFDGSDGKKPMGQVALDENGTLYGTTNSGGDDNVGVLYSISATGEYKNLYHFKKFGSDAKNPVSGVVLHKGVLYGTANDRLFVYQLATNTYSIGYDFTKNGESGGRQPSTGYYIDDQGNIYGTTYQGGLYVYNGRGSGTIFKLTKNSGDYTFNYETLHDFGGNGDIGASPIYAGLTLADDGYLYGTTTYNITDDTDGTSADTGYGTIFRIKPDGSGYETVYKFKGTVEGDINDGKNPKSLLVIGPDRRLYGTTIAGGYEYNYENNGVVFSYDPATKAYEVIYRFQADDMTSPHWGVVFDSNKVMYGTATNGGITTDPSLDSGGGGLYRLIPEN